MGWAFCTLQRVLGCTQLHAHGPPPAQARYGRRQTQGWGGGTTWWGRAATPPVFFRRGCRSRGRTLTVPRPWNAVRRCALARSNRAKPAGGLGGLPRAKQAGRKPAAKALLSDRSRRHQEHHPEPPRCDLGSGIRRFFLAKIRFLLAASCLERNLAHEMWVPV